MGGNDGGHPKITNVPEGRRWPGSLTVINRRLYKTDKTAVDHRERHFEHV